MSKNLGRKILTCIALISIIAQSFSPYVEVLPKAYAQVEDTPTIDQTQPDTATPTPTIEQAQPTDTITPAPTDTPTETVTPTPVDEPTTVTPTPTDNLSPPADNSNNQSSNDNQNSSNNPSTPTVTPVVSITPIPTETTTGDEQLSMTILKNISAPTIDLEMVVSEGSAVLTTDKPDYAPTDTALITGSNLRQDTNYSLIISSTDNPATSTTVNVTSDDKGLFAYAYQLDGNYRPNYKAELRDATGALVASTTFTDNVVGVTTQPATGITTTGATLNGTNGVSAANQESFWVSTNTFSTASPTIPAGVYSTPVLTGVGAGVPFSDPLSLVTTNGIITGGVPGNMPAITPNTTYYFTAWSNVSGTWHPGEVLNFTTLPGPVFIDTNTNGVLDPGEQSFLTIQAAITAATSGNTIVATAGTYNERIIIDKPLILTGAGVGQSIIDATSFGTVGSVVDITGLTGNIKIEGFDIKTGDYDNGIVSSGGTDASGTIEIKNNHIIGTNLTATGDQFGIIAGYGDVRTLVISGNQISNTYNNSILVERQLGETEITNNILDGAFPSIFFMTYNGNDVTTLQKVNKNTIDMVSADPTWYGSAITFNSARRNDPSTSLGSGKYTNISIVENTIKNLSTTSLYNYKGIYLVNDDPAGTGGETTDAVISGNQISGATGNNAVGIKLSGKITGTVLSNNTIKDLSVGLLGASNNNGAGTQYPSTTTFSDKNSLSGNTVGVNWPSQSSLLNANNNWWGNASGPYDNKTLPGTPNYNNPSGTGNAVSSNVDYKPWFIDSSMTTLSSANPITEAATGKTLTGATLNGTNGDYDATNTSFWWGTTSAGSFSSCTSCDSQLPSGWTHDTGLGAKTAGGSFNEPLTGLTPGTPYYFVAWSEVGGTWYPGNVLNFTTTALDTIAPATPSLVSPADGVYRHTSNSNKSDWTDVTDPSSPVVYYYESSLSTATNSDGSFTSTAYTSSALSTSEIMNPGEPEVTYYWHVKACDAVGNCSAWSSPWQIHIDNTAPTVPTNGTPHNTTIATNNFDFNWDTSTDASPITYAYQASLNPAQSSGVLTTGLWHSGVLPSNTIHSSGAGDGTWYWQVKAVDAAGNESAWSPIWNVTLDTIAPTTPGQIGWSTENPPVGSDYTSGTDFNNYRTCGQSLNYSPMTNLWGPSTDANGVAGYDREVYSPEGTLISPSSLTTNYVNGGGAVDGSTYWVRVRAYDAAGNKSDWTPKCGITYDVAAPTVSSVDSDGQTYNLSTASPHAIKVTFSEDIANTPIIAINPPTQSQTVNDCADTDAKTFCFNYTIDTAREVTHTIFISGAKDAAGNTMTQNSSHTFIVDTKAPTIAGVTTTTANGAYTIGQVIDFEVSFNEAVNVSGGVPEFLVSAGPGRKAVYSSGSGTNTLTFNYTVGASDGTPGYLSPNNGNVNLNGATIRDTAGNDANLALPDNSIFLATHSIVIDTTVPTVAFTESSPQDGLITGDNTQTFNVSVSEPVSSCTFKFNDNYSEVQIPNGLSDGLSFTPIISGDDNATMYTLPFSFPFYGNSYNVLSVSTNALLRFASSADPSLSDSVSNLLSRIGIATLWDDLVTTVSVITSPNDVRFRWTGTGWSTGGTLTNEAVLRSNGQVELHYGNVNLPSRNITAGLSAGNGLDYVLSSVNGQSVISPISFSYSPGGATGTYPMTIKSDGTYSVTVSGIADGTSHYSVTCTDLATNEGKTDSRSITVDTTAPSEPTANPPAGDYSADQLVSLSSSDSGSGLAGIFYTTDGSTPNNTSTPYTTPITVDKDMTIKAIAYDNVGNASSILTAHYGIPPVISSETSASVTSDSVTITWTTDDLSTSRVVYDTVSHEPYGIAPNYGYASSTTEDSTKVTLHSVGLTGLSSGTTYYYRVISHGSPEAVGDENSFTTSNPPSNPGGPGDGLGCAVHDCSGNQIGGPSSSSTQAVLGASTGPQAFQLAFAPGAGAEQEVLGAQNANSTSSGSETNPTATPTPTGQNPVSNSANWVLNHIALSFVILIILGVIAYFIYRKKKKK